HLGLAAAKRLLEGDLEIVAQVIAAIGAALATAAAAHHRAEHFLENIGAAAEAEIAGAAAPAILEGGMAETVIGRAPLLVLQHVIGFVDRLEAVLGLLVARIAVGVILHGELTERLLDVFGRGLARHAEKLVEVVFLRHCPYPLPPPP